MKNIFATKVFYYSTPDTIRSEAREQPKNDVKNIIGAGNFFLHNYENLDNKVQALGNLKIGEEITQKDFDTVQKGIQESIQNALQKGKWIRVYDEETIRKFAKYAEKSEQADALVKEMQDFNKTPRNYQAKVANTEQKQNIQIPRDASRYEGFLKLKDGKLVLEDSKTNILSKEYQDDTGILLKLGITSEQIASNLQQESLNTTINTVQQVSEQQTETETKQTEKETEPTPPQQEFQNTKNLHEATKELLKLNTQEEFLSLQQEIWVTQDAKIGRKTLRAYFNKISDTTERKDAIKKFQEAIGLTGDQVDGKIGKQTERASMAYYEQQLAKNKSKTEEKQEEVT